MSPGGELEAAISAAREAGEVLRSGFGKSHDVEYKGEVDLVTETDAEAERVVVEKLREAFPGYGVLSEEGGTIAEGEGGRWIVDPLDGTVNYAHALPFFAVSIALEKMGKPAVGVVYDPLADELYTARRDEGAYRNGEPLQVSRTPEPIQALVATGFPHDRDRMSGALEIFGRFAVKTRSMRRLGSAALNLCYVAAGRLDAYYERGVNPWDVAAGVLLVEAAGGRITDYNGRDFDLDSPEVVASNGLLHPAMVETTGGA